MSGDNRPIDFEKALAELEGLVERLERGNVPLDEALRTFERGVEGETLACGTGVTASALISSRVHNFGSPVKVQVQGGEQLEVSFKENEAEFADVRLTGSAEFVFEGKIEV